ncbi:MAG: TfoX/Sxy family protein [Pseudomonadota bacterium]
MTAAFEDHLAERVKLVLGQRGPFTTTRIIGGGTGFMVCDKLCCGVSRRGLVVRLGPNGASAAAKQEGVAPLMLGKRTARGFVRVDPDALKTNEQIDHWVLKGVEFLHGDRANS